MRNRALALVVWSVLVGTGVPGQAQEVEQSYLLGALKHKDPSLRSSAARLIGENPSQFKFAVHSLIDALEQEGPQPVKDDLAAALEKITGEKLGTDVKAWKDWWEAQGRALYSGPFQTATERRIEELDQDIDKELDEAKGQLRLMMAVILMLIFLFIVASIYFGATLANRLKGVKDTLARAEEQIESGKEIIRKTDKILEGLEAKKGEIVQFTQKLKEECRSDIEAVSDLMENNLEHQMREITMGLRQKAELELRQTLSEVRADLERDFRKFATEYEEKASKSQKQVELSFLREVEAHSTFLEASFYYANGRYQDALRLYKKLLVLKPTHAVAWNNYGTILRELKLFSEAYDAYGKALEFSPDDPTILYNVATTYAQQRRKDKMLETLRRAIELDGEFKDEALNDRAFEPFWNDPEFKDIAEG